MWFFGKKSENKKDQNLKADENFEKEFDSAKSGTLGALVEPVEKRVKVQQKECKKNIKKNLGVEKAEKDQSQKEEKTSFSENSSIFVAGNLFKAAVFFAIALSAVVGNFFIENHFAQGSESVEFEFTAFNYSEDNFIPNNGIVRFDQRKESIVENYENSPNLINSTNTINSHEYLFTVLDGELWGNFLISDAKVNFLMDRVVLIPDRAQFSLEFDGEKAVLDVFDGDVFVGFLEQGVEITEYTDQYSDIFMNKLLVPRDTQVTITMSKISEKLSTILTAKLMKEFKYTSVPTSVKDSLWTTTNKNRDQKFLDDEKQTLISKIIRYGKTVDDGMFANFIFWSEENLTFVPEKKNRIIFDHLFAYLDDAIYYANEGDLVASKNSWEEFKNSLVTQPDSVTESDEYKKTIDAYIDRLSIFDPGDKQYYIFSELASLQNDKYKVVNLLWRDVYASLNVNDAIAEEALSNYYNELDSTFGDYENFEFYKDYITYQNQLFDNLFLRYPIFYKNYYFEIKDVIENELLGLYEEGRLKDELRQSMIDAKFDFMKRLMKFFFEEKIPVDEAKKILSRLNQDIKNLMPGESNAAVLSLFESRLDDIGDFWGYLNSPEYHMLKVYGVNHEEKYKSYLEDREIIWSVIDFQEDVLGETFREVTVEDVRKEVKTILEAADVKEYEIGGIEDTSQRYVKIKGVVGGYPFEALYDRDKISVKDVYVYDELITDRSIKLHNLLSLIHDKYADVQQVDTQQGDEEYSVESFAERAARLYIKDLVAEAGFVVNFEDVSVVNEEEAIYRIEQVTLDTYDDILITFDFRMKNEKATNVLFSVGGRPSVFEDEYTLDEIKSIVQAEADFDENGGVVR